MQYERLQRRNSRNLVGTNMKQYAVTCVVYMLADNPEEVEARVSDAIKYGAEIVEALSCTHQICEIEETE